MTAGKRREGLGPPCGVGDAHSWPIDLTYRFISDFVRICFRFLLQLERDWKLFRTSDLRRSLKDNFKVGEKNMIWSQTFLVFLWRPLRQSFQCEINTFRKLVCGKVKKCNLDQMIFFSPTSDRFSIDFYWQIGRISHQFFCNCNKKRKGNPSDALVFPRIDQITRFDWFICWVTIVFCQKYRRNSFSLQNLEQWDVWGSIEGHLTMKIDNQRESIWFSEGLSGIAIWEG